MSDPPTLSGRRYRWVDRLTKLAGLGLVAVGLDVGGGTPEGIALAVVGAALATATVFVQRGEETHREPTDDATTQSHE